MSLTLRIQRILMNIFRKYVQLLRNNINKTSLILIHVLLGCMAAKKLISCFFDC